jgi:hypothetical protein
MANPRPKVSKGDSKNLPGWHRFSITTERLAFVLKAIASYGKMTSAKGAQDRIAFLIRLRDAALPSMKEHSEIFAAVGSPGDVVCIDRRQYASAHHAAIGEAEFFLSEFGRGFPEDWWKPPFDPSDIINNLENARNDISDSLPGTWQADFRTIPVRIQRERAAATCRPHKPIATNGPKKIKPTPGTLNVIRRIEKGDDIDKIVEATHKTPKNVCKIRCYFHQGKYEL